MALITIPAKTLHESEEIQNLLKGVWLNTNFELVNYITVTASEGRGVFQLNLEYIKRGNTYYAIPQEWLTN